MLKKKISLTLKTKDNPHGIVVGNQKTDRERKEGRKLAEKKREEKQMSNEQMREYLLKKFGR